jgi:transcriptional regulator with PAS, ATPase and Fis domain
MRVFSTRFESVEDGVVSRLQEYDWPGNVRELENSIERAIVLSGASTITRDAVTLEPATVRPADMPSLNLRQNLEWMERETIRRALRASTAKRHAAKLMGISPRSLSYYLGKYPLVDEYRTEL